MSFRLAQILLSFVGIAFGGDDAEMRRIKSLSLSRLSPIVDDGGNPYSQKPAAKSLGEKLFYDTKLSRSGDVSCASCHVPERAFASEKVLLDPTRGWRNVPTLYGVARQSFFFWDGRKDSLWAQAVGPLTNPREHGLDEVGIARHIADRYRKEYESIFGPMSDSAERITADVGKALAAFETTIAPPRTAFDDFADGNPAPTFGDCEQRGARTFVGKGRCVSCHNGPLLTNQHFHNTGVPLKDLKDNPAGFFVRYGEIKFDPYRCGGAYSDDERCAHIVHASVTPNLAGAMKTPTLRGIKNTAPYMHNGSMPTLRTVIDHYDEAPSGHLGDSEVFPIGLTDAEKDALECFLNAL